MSGWIFAREKQPRRTQKLYKRASMPQNPRRQNYKYLKALEVTPGVSLEPLHSALAVVPSKPKYRSTPPRTSALSAISSYSSSWCSERPKSAPCCKLCKPAAAPPRHHHEHVQNLKRRSDPTTKRQCPKCGNALMIRTVKSGPKAGQYSEAARCTPHTGRCRALKLQLSQKSDTRPGVLMKSNSDGTI
jgi:restriction system protein